MLPYLAEQIPAGRRLLVVTEFFRQTCGLARAAALAVLAGALMISAAAQDSAEPALSPEEVFRKDIHPLVETYCLKCHGDERPKGGVSLTKYKEIGAIHRDPKAWETILAQLRDRTMPPESKPQPSNEERERLMLWIESTLQNLDEKYVPKDPGRIVIHRLNRLEYNNTVRDLFGVTSNPADKFPADGGGGGGFDNNADTLFVPPILMEKYLEAAEDVVSQADPARLFVARPGAFTSKQAAAKKIIDFHAPRVFRRPVTNEETLRLLSIFDRALKRGAAFEDAVKLSVKAMLVSPSFLFRIEEDQSSDAPYQINDFELASRLSYFLWSSMPDNELFRLAREGKLRQPEVIEAQIQRMMADSRSRVFADNFAGQWLKVRDLGSAAQPDGRAYPAFTPSLRDAMYQEAVEFFYSIFREDGSILYLLDADYTFVNAELAELYDIKGVEGAAMQRVKLADRNRGGVLGMGSVLTLTSYPRRTSPVLRGKWILDEMFGAPPPPPPPLVQSLPQDDRPRDGLSLRQRLEKHREKAECASCHKRMDPLGFGLENFDGIGRWRTEISQQPVDASGEMVTGEKFQGPVELKKILLGKKDEFSRHLVEKMLAYALGRGLEYYDMPAVKKILKAVAENDYKGMVMVREIVMSFPFQHRRNQPVETASNE